MIAAKGYRVADMATQLDVSIATAKRLLNGDDLSVSTMMKLCDWIHLDFYDLIEISKRQRVDYHYISSEQEKFLASRLGHLSFLRALQKGEDLNALQAQNHLSRNDVEGYLADLEAFSFLKRDENGNVELLVKDGMDWRPGGALWQAYFATWVQQICDYMISASKQTESSIIDISQRKMTRASILEFKRETDELSRKYAAISRLERRVHKVGDLEYLTTMTLGDAFVPSMWSIPPYGR